MLRKLRIILAAFFFAALTLLFLDFTGALHAWLGWTAKVQALEAVLALNAVVIIGLVVVVLLFGRVYCSVICPLGITQDIIAWIHGNRKKNRYSFKKANNWLRYGFLGLFIILMILGLNAIACLIAPYSAYGRIATELMAPVYGWCNNLFAAIAQRAGSYAFYPTEVWMKSLPTFIVAAVTFVLIFILAWKGGRTWCNSVCPVGTTLGLLSRFSLFKPVIDTEKCNGCTLCSRKCKASCINPAEHKIDYSRCVVCMDCLENCHQGAISYKPVFLMKSKKKETAEVDNSRRGFLAAGAMLLSAVTLKAQKDKVKAGSAKLQNKLAPARKTPVKELLRPLRDLPAVRHQVSLRSAQALIRPRYPDAARDVVRKRVLPRQLQRLLDGMPRRRHPAGEPGGEIFHPRGPRRGHRRELRRPYGECLLRQLRAPLPRRRHQDGAPRGNQTPGARRHRGALHRMRLVRVPLPFAPLQRHLRRR